MTIVFKLNALFQHNNVPIIFRLNTANYNLNYRSILQDKKKFRDFKEPVDNLMGVLKGAQSF